MHNHSITGLRTPHIESRRKPSERRGAMTNGTFSASERGPRSKFLTAATTNAGSPPNYCQPGFGVSSSPQRPDGWLLRLVAQGRLELCQLLVVAASLYQTIKALSGRQ